MSGPVDAVIAPGRDRYRARILWAIALVAVLSAVALSLLRLPSPAHQWPMPDLDVYRQGVILFLEGVDPYDRPLGIGQLPYTYPPFSLIAFLPLALINPGLPLAAVFNTVLLGVAIWAVLRSYPQTGAIGFLQITARQAVLGAAILVGVQWLQPVNSNTVLGQVNVVLMALVVVDMLVVRSRWRGLLTGVAAMVKLTPVVFLLYPMWTRDRRAVANAIIACAALLMLSLVTLPRITTEYFAGGMFDQNLPGRTYPGIVFNQSLRGFALRVFGPGTLETTPTGVTPVVEIIWIATSILILGLLYLGLHGLDPVADRALALGYIAMAGLLISPVSWTHHWVWVVPLAAATASSLRRFPLVAVPVVLMAVSMVDEPWFVRHWYEAGNYTSLMRLSGLNPYLCSGFLVLMTGAYYGLRRRRQGHG